MDNLYISEIRPELREQMEQVHAEMDVLREHEGVRAYAEATDGGTRACEIGELMRLLRRPEIQDSQLGMLLVIEHLGLRLKHDGEVQDDGELEIAEICLAHCEEGYRLIGQNQRAADMADTLCRLHLNEGRVGDALDDCKRGDKLLGTPAITPEEGTTEEMRIAMAADSHRTLRYRVHRHVIFA